jgi:hypothetical protein
LRKRRRKRQEIGGIAPDTEGGLRPIPNILDLEPFAFDTRLGGVILEVKYLRKMQGGVGMKAGHLRARLLTFQKLKNF